MWNDTVHEVDHRKETTRWTRQVEQSREVRKEVRTGSSNGRWHPSQAKEDHTKASSRKRPRQRPEERKSSEVKQNPQTAGRPDRIAVRIVK